MAWLHNLSINAVAIGLVTGCPFQCAIGPAIGPVTGRPLQWLLVRQLVRQLVTCEQVTLVPKVTVSVVSTTVWLRKTRWKLGNDDCIETP